MAAAVIEKRYYDAESPETAGIYALMLIDTQLPPAPYAGMYVRSARGDSYQLDRICWDADEQKFSCTAKPSFLDRKSGDSFDELIEYKKSDGWILRGRYDNDDLKPREDASTKDDEDSAWDEIEHLHNKLSEAKKLEFHRRHDLSMLLGTVAAYHHRELERLRPQRQEAEKIKRFTKQSVWLVGGFLGLSIVYDFLFSGATEIKFWLAISAASISISAQLFGDRVERLAIEIGRHEEGYRCSSLEWQLLTGKRFRTEEAEIERATLGYGSEEGADKHCRGIKLSILRKLNNFDDSSALRWG